MSLNTRLKHVETGSEFKKIIEENENVMVCCGRMGPMCVPVYFVMEKLERDIKNVVFRDFDFDSPDARIIKEMPECRNFMGLPFTVYYKNGKLAKATSGIQNEKQVKDILEKHLLKTV
ncbi:MAG: thioredoxin family protein [Candidatus Goldbacteria bacterium]|nr:thioredoxin family protein [Candidatus Goldiibacteriota bacterium]